ncbi:heterocyst development glycosyltransferase HepC [Rivularia sp. UHCC 0363]|uniref:heterocyst development glycosyltransferase HepC n=1 Tax=Rivularia sp. UHCC 0363 TaxID=3110244 RepID=UPI002B218F45|nr:heterocyst development glycosyltransferase HepC [Rivularia sp. UHCC 0363]MEA5597607.1 heterocyst development glycosyltransferase HepC [Rivularia sp. UHCC 0363]
MTTSIVPTLYNSDSALESNSLPYCTLQWRRNQLLVKYKGTIKQPYMPLLDNHESLKECLKHSSVKLVRIDPELGEEKVRLWADACAEASKPIYLCIGADKSLKPNSLFLWCLKRLTERAIASVFLVVLSPLMLLLGLLMKVDAQAPIFERSWHVGERGKLFKIIKYRTNADQNIYSQDLENREIQENTLQLTSWMHKSGLENLPQLLNVLRGEIGLFGSRCWTLEEAISLTPEAKKQLNHLPGIMGSWEVEAESNILQHLDSQTS